MKPDTLGLLDQLKLQNIAQRKAETDALTAKTQQGWIETVLRCAYFAALLFFLWKLNNEGNYSGLHSSRLLSTGAEEP